MLFEKTVLNQRGAKAIAIASTIVYLAIFFPLCWIAFFWLAATEPSQARELTVAFSWFWTPITIPISVYSTWSSYRMKNYKRILIWCSLPLLTFGSFMLVSAIERM